MNRNYLLAIVSSALVAILGTNALALTGNVSVRLNGGSADSNKVFIGKTNRLEILISNSANLTALGMCFQVTSTAPYTWARPYGNRPSGGSAIVQEHGPAIGLFADLGGVNIFDHINSATPDTFGLGGCCSPELPLSATLQLCYSLKFTVSASATPHPGGFCIDNVWNSSIPGGYDWTFVASGGGGAIAPTFQGNANSSSTNPSAPAVCFDIVVPTIQNGDVNCDGRISVSDPVYLINYIFGGGPAPCAN